MKAELKIYRESDYRIVLGGWESQLQGEGDSSNMQPVKENIYRTVGSEKKCKPKYRE